MVTRTRNPTRVTVTRIRIRILLARRMHSSLLQLLLSQPMVLLANNGSRPVRPMVLDSRSLDQ